MNPIKIKKFMYGKVYLLIWVLKYETKWRDNVICDVVLINIYLMWFNGLLYV